MKNLAVLAMDIGGTNIRLALVAKNGTVTARSKFDSQTNAGLNAFLATIKSEYTTINRLAAESGQEIIAVGAGVPGLINRAGEIISSVNLKPIEGFNLRQWLENLSGRPVVIHNDANAAAVAEQHYGAGRNFSSLLHFTLGTGVGSGLILDGKLWTGKDGVAAEYGHATVEPQGHLCQCGNHGCLEQYASATAITRLAKAKLAAGAESCLSETPRESLTTAVIAAAAASGDILAVECFHEAGRYLGIAAATAANMLNLEAIILGGGVAASFDLLAPAISKELEQRAFALPASRVKLLRGALGDNAGLMGAAGAAWEFAALS